MTHETNQIRVIIVDDHDIVLRGLSVSLDTIPEVTLVAEASDGETALKLCAEHQPDVLLLDLVMPHMHGIEVIQALRAVSPRTEVVALTNVQDVDLVRRALDTGAISYLLKNITIDELAYAIRKASRGESIIAPEALSALERSDADRQSFELTEREVEVLGLLARGMSNPAIAEKLVITTATVKNHVSSVLAKLNANTRTEAAMIAVKYDLIEIEV